MNEENREIKATLRIPGNWEHPGQLVEQMPQGYRLTPEALILPDGLKIEFIPMPPDDQFPQIFQSSCRNPPTSAEKEIVESYTVNVGLTATAGSLESARRIVEAGAAIVRAGGAGVFIDNSGVAHGGENWVAIEEDGGSDALGFAFVGIVRGKEEVWTMGMHVAGFQDIVMQRADLDVNGDAIIEVIRYVFGGGKRLEDGHLLVDEDGPRFRAEATDSDEFGSDSPMHNPFGRLKLVSIKDIAERN